MANILRGRPAWQKVGVGRSKFSEDFVLHDENDPYVPDTDKQVRRVRPIPLGERSVGFIEDELDALIEALREFHNSRPLQRLKQPEHLRTGRDTWRERVNKERAASKQQKEVESI
jgi:hypothetical protein